MTRARFVILFGAIAAVSCNDPDIIPPTQLNLDRPVDIGFACYGPVPTGETSAQPPRACNQYSPVLRPLTFNEDTDLAYKWYGFILQSASGTVALSSWQAKPSQLFSAGFSSNPFSDVSVRDADPRTPGKNAISVGEDPIAIGTDVAGCHEITANAGSCDLSVVDINSAVAFDNRIPTQVIVNRLNVLNGAMQPIRARPAAMVMQPSAPDVVAGGVCGPAASGLAFIAYPGCNLVAGVDLATGVIQQGIKFDGAVPSVLSAAELATLSCADECSGGAPTAPATTIRPIALDLRVDARGGTTRLAIGAENRSVLTVVDLDAAFAPQPAPLQIQLEDRTPGQTLGVTALALSPQIAMGNSTTGRRRNNNVDVPVISDEAAPSPADAIGASPGGEGQYVYAVATDGTVRVADVLNVRAECDTQVDMRFVREIASDLSATGAPKAPADIPRLQCFVVGDPATPPRRTGARGPGIELPVDGPATSVTFFQGLDAPITTVQPTVNGVTPPPVESPRSQNFVIGYFAVITTSSGQAFVVNVDDDDGPDKFVQSTPEAPTDSQATAPVFVMAHQLRDTFSARGAVATAMANACTAADPGSTVTGGPRSTAAPKPHVAVDTLSIDPLQANKSLELPSVLKSVCTGTDTTDPTMPVTTTTTVSQLQLGATPQQRDEAYPDLRATVTEAWILTWEGTLSNDSQLSDVDGLPVRSAQMKVDDKGIHLLDQSRPFCEVGVEPFDIVQLRGCNPINGDNECPSGYTCFAHENNQVTGLGACMLTSEAPRLSVACNDFLTTARRYTVAQAASGELTLYPRKHVLATTPVDGCVSDAQCSTLASYALTLRSGKQPFQLTGSNALIDQHTWQCVVDPLRAPLNGDPSLKRCVQTCSATSPCDAGTICVGASATGDVPGTCMESVLPPQSCVNGPQKFEVHASEAFTMIGSRSGYVHSVVEQGGQCVSVKTPGSVQVGRIPLVAPACDPLANPFTGELPGGGFEPNPCSTTVAQADDVPNYLSTDPASPNACVVNSDVPTLPVLRATPAPAVKVRGATMTLTVTDPYSPGDAVCVGDRLGGLGNIPQILPVPFDAGNPFAPTFQLTFDQKAGFTPLQLAPQSLTVGFPVKVVRGPSESIWVMDAGDVLVSGLQATKGQVYRIEMLGLGTVNVLQ